MKNLLFAVQVFGLITAFPLYTMFELNHTTELLTVVEKSAGFLELPETFVLKMLVETTADFNSQELIAKENYSNNNQSKK